MIGILGPVRVQPPNRARSPGIRGIPRAATRRSPVFRSLRGRPSVAFGTVDPVLSAESAGLASLLRAARELAGMSRSELARCLDMSWETIHQAEEGRDVRHSTLSRILLAFPYLSPRALVLGEATASPLASSAIWDF